MPDPTRRSPPLPIAQSFVTCREVFRGQQSGTALLHAPFAHLPVTHFPTHVRMAVFAEFTGGHGLYHPALELRDAAGQVVWGWPTAQPFQHADPLLPSEVVFNDLSVAVPRAGRYTLVLILNGQDAAQRTLWLGPVAAFRPPATPPP